jgi:hypothetical protein
LRARHANPWPVLPSLAAALALVASLLPSLAAASDTATVVTDAAQNPDARGTGVGSVGLDMGILDPDSTHDKYHLGFGFNVQVVGGRTGWWPFMFGLGGGFITFDSTTQDGPITGYVDDDGSFGIATTSDHRSVEIRHAEAIVRIQPWWGRVRPYVEGAVGLAVLWHASSLRNTASNEVIAYADEQRDASVLFGGTLGVEWELWPMWEHEAYSYSLVLTTAVKRWYTGPMERPRYVGSADEALRTEGQHEMLAMWVPLIALSISVDSRSPRKGAPVAPL